MKKLNFIILSIFCLNIYNQLISQTNVLEYNPKPLPEDGHSYVTHSNFKNRVLDYPFVREDDILWTKTYVSQIDLREKVNQPLFFPVVPVSIGGGKFRSNLSQILLDAVKSGQITAYDDTPEEYFSEIVTPQELEALLFSVDSTEEENLDTGELELIIDTLTVQNTDIKAYYVIEDKFFDKKRSVLDSRIIGIAPIAELINKETFELEPTILFWVWYPEIRQILANSIMHNDEVKFTGPNHMTFSEFFDKRLFSSTIRKESNMYDRAIYDYKKSGMQQLLEAERIKNDIRNLENDMWEY
jgi:gliding motility associated protien GldN